MRTRPIIAALALVAVVGLNAVPAGAGAVIEVKGIDATAALSPGGHRLRVLYRRGTRRRPGRATNPGRRTGGK